MDLEREVTKRDVSKNSEIDFICLGEERHGRGRTELLRWNTVKSSLPNRGKEMRRNKLHF